MIHRVLVQLVVDKLVGQSIDWKASNEPGREPVDVQVSDGYVVLKISFIWNFVSGVSLVVVNTFIMTTGGAAEAADALVNQFL